MRRMIFIILGLVWLIFWFLWGFNFGVNETPLQIKKNREFKNTQLAPLVNKVDSFLVTNNRLPSEGEFNKMYRTLTLLPTVEYYQADKFEGIPELDKIQKGRENYVLVAWRGEWNEYYTSWDDHYSVDDFTKLEGLYNFLFSLLIGGLPFILILKFVK
jgi:hypothetical protein